VVIAIVIALATSPQASGAPEVVEPKVRYMKQPQRHQPRMKACPYAYLALAFYRGRYMHHQVERGAPIKSVRDPRGCPHARYLVRVWIHRAYAARIKTARWKAAQRRKLRWDPMVAINTVFGSYASQAHRVSSCESGHSPSAVNGQYLGMFQMGDYARSRYGHGPDPLTQARAAYHYFVDSGRDWSPWSCKP